MKGLNSKTTGRLMRVVDDSAHRIVGRLFTQRDPAGANEISSPGLVYHMSNQRVEASSCMLW